MGYLAQYWIAPHSPILSNLGITLNTHFEIHVKASKTPKRILTLRMAAAVFDETLENLHHSM
jgi:hypothetical protein